MRRRNREKKEPNKGARAYRREKHSYYGENFEIFLKTFIRSKKIEGPLRSAVYALNSPVAETRKKALTRIKELGDARALVFLDHLLQQGKARDFRQILKTVLALGGKETFIERAKQWFKSESTTKDFFYEIIAEGKVTEKELVEPLTASWVNEREHWTPFGGSSNRNQAMHRLSLELAKKVSEQAGRNLLLAGDFFMQGGLSEEQNLVLRMGLASRKAWLDKLPSDLKDRKQRSKIEYLKNLRAQARDLSVREIAEHFNLVKPLKIVD